MCDYGDTAGVLANERKLAQVFLNLLINAAQSFRIADARVNEVILRTQQPANDVVLVEVQDTGEGIPEGRTSTGSLKFDPGSGNNLRPRWVWVAWPLDQPRIT